MSSPSESTELTGPRRSAEHGEAEHGGPEHGVAVSIACPTCHRLVAADAPCPQCGSPPVPVPPSSAEPTVVLPPVPERTAELEIPTGTGEPEEPAGPPTAWFLDPAATPGPAQFVPGELPRTEVARRRRGAGVLGGAAALVLVGAAAVAGLRAGGQQATSGAGDGAAPASSGTVPLSPARVRVSASSTQHPDGGVSYVPANTLDGDPETAWNSDGQGAGATLTYTFGSPVELRSITVLNGYQKVLTGSGGKRVDLFELNERVKTVQIATDAGTTVWTLRDDRSAQTLTGAFGTTRTVRMRVLAVYPSQRYKDLAVSDVAFGVASG